MAQQDYAFTKETFIEMLGSIRDRAKDNKVIYLFMDNAGYHGKANGNGIVENAYKDLNIIPVYNVGYQYMLNPVERYWSLVKHYYRRILLDKMLKCPTAREQPMRDALRETFENVNATQSIPKFIRKAQHILRRQANAIRRERGLDELDH